MNSFVKQYLEELNSTLEPEYSSWLKRYITEHKFFTDNPNTVENRLASEEDMKNISKISKFFSLVEKIYEKQGFEVVRKEGSFRNMLVTINLDAETTIEMITWIGQGAETQVTLVAAGCGKVNLADVLKAYRT